MTLPLKKLYEEQIKDTLKKEFLYKNTHEIPKITKIIINRGLGEAYLELEIFGVSAKEILMAMVIIT